MIHIINSYAKINLFLDVLKKRDDGYHEIKSVMQKIDLHDTLIFFVNKQSSDNPRDGITITTNKKYLPTDENNLCYKAILYFKNNFNIKDDIKLYIIKRIPISAGLGGGSSNFFATINFLNNKYKLKLSKNDLINISNLYGSDIAFFSSDVPCLCEGRGEILTPLPYFNFKLNIKIETPNIRVSTKDIYTEFDNYKNLENNEKKINNILSGIKNKNLNQIYDNCFNVLENITIKKHPEILDIKNKNINNGAKCSLMSGSGPSVFSIY